MVISILFSVIIYANVNSDLVQIEERQRRMYERQKAVHKLFERLREEGIIDSPMADQPQQNLEIVAEARRRFILMLAVINMGILGVSGIAGYFLAGRTLRPIQDMLSEQRRFIADASHELRTPLTSLRSEIEVSLSDTKLSLPGAKHVLRSNLEDVIRLQSLSDNLLTLAQFEKNTLPQFAKVRLADIINDAVRKIAGLAKKKNTAIQFKGGRQYSINGNAESLTELFVILLDNAIKYSPRGGKVTIASSKINQHLKVAISDKGIGIEKKDIEKIFDRFFRADSSRTKTETAGYGLGLAIAKKIAEQHGGDISVKSTLGKGSTFFVTLPLRR